MVSDKIYKYRITYFNGTTHNADRYFDKKVHICLLEVDPGAIAMSNNNFYIDIDNPSFYDLMEYLVDAYLNRKEVSLYDSDRRIMFIAELGNLSEEKKKKNAIENCLFVFKNETEMARHSWGKYGGYTYEEKVVFWRSCLSGRKNRLKSFGYDPYYIFSPQVYAFWKDKETDIDIYLNEVIPKLGLERGIVERNLEKTL